MKKKLNHIKTVTIIIIALLIVGLGTFFGAKFIYEKGFEDGKTEFASQISNNVSNLAHSVAEKSEVIEQITDSLSNLPSELNTESINEHIERLNDLKDKIHNDEVKALLEEYKLKWENFREVYSTENNNTISESFESLKNDTVDYSAKIKEALDKKIRESLNILEN